MFDVNGVFSVTILFMFYTNGRCDGPLPMPHGVNYLGVGYNIIDGNPEGGSGNGGVDPGLLLSRRILAFTMNDKLSTDNKYEIPDEVFFLHRSSSETTRSATTFHGTSSYASKLSAKVSVSGEYSGAFVSAEFAASARYERVEDRMSSKGSVFFANETVSNLGHARYLTELAKADEYRLENGFVVQACGLPTAYDESSYMTFLTDWGTNVVTELDVGTREGEDYESTKESFVNTASSEVDVSVSAGGSYAGFSGSIAVDMNTFNEQMTSENSFGSRFSSYAVGSADLNEPISLKLIGINDVFADDYWTKLSDYVAAGYCTDSFQRESVKTNIEKAMVGYANYRSINPSSDPNIVIPLTWPHGQYGLDKPQDGCPTEFTWDTGYRLHDTGSVHPINEWSPELHLFGMWDVVLLEHHFCMKTVAGKENSWAWQPGSYCVYKYGDKCPEGFEDGHIYWGNENDRNGNEEIGVLPTGEYNSENTKTYFCCRNDGVTDKQIYLPTDDSFYLLPRHGFNCQRVHGMILSREFFHWGNSGDDEGNSQSDVHPADGVIRSAGVRLNLCYYTPMKGWPDGTYGIPKPTSGCPTDEGWVEGTRYFDTEDDDADNEWSDTHLAGSWDVDNMEQQFCMKTTSNDESKGDWPAGTYCIYKYGDCPTGFEAGWIQWDDENDNNENENSGTLPDGVYDADTKIEFCCRSDSPPDVAIDLQIPDPFYLFAATEPCQRVNGMNTDGEWFKWDTEDDDSSNAESPVRPLEGLWEGDIVLAFCYYYQ